MPIASHPTALGQREQKKDRDLLYTAEEKKRRDETIWTLVQGVPVSYTHLRAHET